ncbi:hypothetical protein JM18_008580 [Phytophthora kernoviae]|uniref:Apple domain-containing protein n=2 Tax=Phytophthora kernoviae TaxID=325452 RepID=A0A921S9S9_9STRA|nr:hypothetical protein G195_010826 [Phytophthora kernoviae 00238/432]KAG2510991.1 hypothetical protein JM18_008580 [Phytophthora kernoviae]
MTRFKVLALVLLSALYSYQVDAAKLRSLAQVPFLPVHRRLASCPLTTGVDYLGNDIKNVPADTPGCALNDNIDFQGNDIANVKNANPGSCCSVCSTWSGCKAFSWSNLDGGTCWLKSAKGTEVSKTGVKSAEVTNTVDQCTLQYGVDFVGNDIGNSPGSNPSMCCGVCNNWRGCRSFTWSNLNGGTCWLKSAKGTTASKSGVVSSQVLDNPQSSCTLEPNTDYVGNDIGNVLAAKPSDCCSKCRSKTGCSAFSWSNLNGGTCWLKSSKGSMISASGVTSAVVF